MANEVLIKLVENFLLREDLREQLVDLDQEIDKAGIQIRNMEYDTDFFSRFHVVELPDGKAWYAKFDPDGNLMNVQRFELHVVKEEDPKPLIQMKIEPGFVVAKTRFERMSDPENVAVHCIEHYHEGIPEGLSKYQYRELHNRMCRYPGCEKWFYTGNSKGVDRERAGLCVQHFTTVMNGVFCSNCGLPTMYKSTAPKDRKDLQLCESCFDAWKMIR
jgi:hypothetical protein